MLRIFFPVRSLAVQRLRLCASTARGHGFNPWSGTNIPYVAWYGQKKKIITQKHQNNLKILLKTYSYIHI